MTWVVQDDKLNWLGEWDATYTYGQFDAVLYRTSTDTQWHTFVSKTTHNAGNIPATSIANWRRLYQEQWL